MQSATGNETALGELDGQIEVFCQLPGGVHQVRLDLDAASVEAQQ